MKSFLFIIFASILLLCCNHTSEISKEFDCDKKVFSNLEKVEDMKRLFSIDLPKDWKINLYEDEIQSSIFTADTTKQLTETVLLDVTFIEKNINFNEAFLLNQEQENLSKKLIKIKSRQITFLDKPALFILYKGKKGKYSYQLCNTFIKVNEQNFILAKTEIYGDSIVDKRLCSAISLLENIKLNQ
jgi:hypothetical protein